MRMRRKKNLEDRLQNCSEYLICADGEDLNYQTASQIKEYIDFRKLFGNDNPIELEIGCGKGGFICELAKQNPDKNFIAVEKTGNVIVNGCEKAQSEEISNLRFFKCGAEYLEKYIPEHSVDNIYLNFSCPFPKKKYASHRLTNRNFLKIYKKLLKNGGFIFQKTDNMHFFEYSIEEFSQSGFALRNVTFDLHNSGFEGNIMTEYEKRFSELGQPIYRLEAYLLQQGDE